MQLMLGEENYEWALKTAMQDFKHNIYGTYKYILHEFVVKC